MLRVCLSILAMVVGMAVLPSAQTQAPDAKPSKPAVVVNLNSASQQDFEKLPGIGPRVAARIVEYRQKNGR